LDGTLGFCLSPGPCSLITSAAATEGAILVVTMFW
jgi:hypothetical protein